jgi:hypothetical protein
MKFSYVPTFAEYRAALRLHYRQKLSRRILHQVDLWLLPSIMFLFLISSVYRLVTDPENYSGGIGWELVGLAFASVVPLSRFYGVRKQFRMMFPNGNEEVWVDLDDERVISTIPGTGEGKYFWTGILGSAQDEKIILLYIRKNMFLFFPTIALSPTVRAEVSDLISSKLVNKKC